jgi:hypothetical protein
MLQGTLTKEGRLNTIDPDVKIVRFVKKKCISSILKSADLN